MTGDFMNKQTINMFIVICMVLAWLSMPVQAADMASVSTFSQLQSALADSSVSRIIFLNDITATAKLSITRDVTIDGNGFTIKAQVTGTDERGVVNSNPSEYNIFEVRSTASPATIENLTVKGGGESAIYNKTGSFLILRNVIITQSGSASSFGSASSSGGGINSYNAYTYLINSTVTGNVTDNPDKNAHYGGGIGYHQGTLHVINSVVVKNYATVSDVSFVPSDIGKYVSSNVYAIHSLVGAYVTTAYGDTYPIPESINSTEGDVYTDVFSEYEDSPLRGGGNRYGYRGSSSGLFV